MKKNTALKIINPILLLLFMNQAITWLLHHQIAEASYQTWQFLHKGLGMVFIGLLLIHFILNFNWIKANYFKSKRAI